MQVRMYVPKGVPGATSYGGEECFFVLSSSRPGTRSLDPPEMPAGIDREKIWYTLSDKVDLHRDVVRDNSRENGVYLMGGASIEVRTHNGSSSRRISFYDIYEGTSTSLEDLLELYYDIRAGRVSPAESWDKPPVQEPPTIRDVMRVLVHLFPAEHGTESTDGSTSASNETESPASDSDQPSADDIADTDDVEVGSLSDNVASDSAIPSLEEALLEVADSITGLQYGIRVASDQLGLTSEQIGIFVRNTPGNKKGEDLWREFTSRRDKVGDQEDYNFARFMIEVLAEAGFPISTSDHED